MKNKFLCLLVICTICATVKAQSAYVIPNFTSENPRDLYRDSSNDERLDNISATFGIDDEWSFVLYSNGTFESREWYGYSGRYDTRYMKDIKESSGTYYITRNDNGARIVHFRFRNGKEKNGFLRYKSHNAELSFDGKTHREMY